MENEQNKLRARIKYAKYGVMRYVGHLDIMRFFQKAIRRANIPIAYSKGFHPHQILSFALPLGVGLETYGDYLDVVLTQRIDEALALSALNEQMADDIRVLSFSYLNNKAKKAMAAVCAAEYKVTVSGISEALPDLVGGDLARQFFSDAILDFYDKRNSIIIEKQTKKSTREVDLKPLIHRFEVAREDASDNGMSFLIGISAGSTDNIKPELLMEHFLRYIIRHYGYDEGILDKVRYHIIRLDLLTLDEGGYLVSLNSA